MKIIEKKCPNCGANLNFKVGERDIACDHCRRKFAVQYDGTDFSKLDKEMIDSLLDSSVELIKPFSKYSRLFVITTAVIIFTITIIFSVIVSNITKQKREESERQFQQTVQENQERYEQTVQENQERYEQNVKEAEEQYQKSLEEMQK